VSRERHQRRSLLRRRGGASTGIEAALGRKVDVAVNHSEIALAVHKANHPKTVHLTSNIWDVDPFIATRGRHVDLLWASPDCTSHSRAKGGKPRSHNIRSLAHVVTQWARAVAPRLICVENVPEFEEWCPLDADGFPIKSRSGETFARWCGELRLLGYNVEHRVLDASRYGAPTKRKRLFIIARRDGLPVQWPEPTHGPGLLPLRSAAECIDWSLPCRSIFERKKPLADKTLWRIAQGIKRYVLDDPAPFIVGGYVPTLIQTGYGERPGQRPRYLDLSSPLNTVVAGGSKHALVSAFISRYYSGQRPVIGKKLDAPLPTVTAWDHNSLAAVTLAKFRGTDPSQPGCADIRAPLGTISAGGVHFGEVRALLETHNVPGPHTLELNGDLYAIADIGLRMLEPHELLRAQFGRFAESYDLSAATTKEAKIRLIGNSVPPEVVEALVLANTRQAVMEVA
jgi:DNA (cytosine-5)-methyltransferase 1